MSKLSSVLRIALLFTAILVSACGGGGDDGPVPTPGTAPAPGPAPVSSATLAQQCDPSNNFAQTPRNGTLDIERRWLRAYLDESYLWYDEVRAVDPQDPIYNTAYAPYSLNQYFDALLAKPKDRFSAMYPTSQLQQIVGGSMQAGYGIEWLTASETPPRHIRIAYVHPNSQAAAAGLRRGDELVSADGYAADSPVNSVGNGGRRDAMYPASTGELHQFLFNRDGVGAINVSFESRNSPMTPVPLASVVTAPNGTRVGYIVFHDHIAPAEAQLIAAVDTLRAQNVSELVLDIRYNGGGYLYIASQLAYMIAGPARTADKVFERYAYNARRTADNNSAESRLGFRSTSCMPAAGGGAMLNCQRQDPLPTLNLPRVHVVTRSSTCSASEAIINGLRGVDVEVIQFGSSTCGKPYGSTPRDNCGISYLPVEFKAANDKGFGDYPNGFSPAGTGPTGLPGCVVNDDLNKALGDPTEGMLASALNYISTGSCPAAASSFEGPRHISASGGYMLRGATRESAIALPLR